MSEPPAKGPEHTEAVRLINSALTGVNTLQRNLPESLVVKFDSVLELLRNVDLHDLVQGLNRSGLIEKTDLKK